MTIASERSKKHPYITSAKDVCGGVPIIQGTRISVWSIIKWYKIGMTIEEILREFPQLTPSQVHDAFSYYYDHSELIEKEILENEDELYWKKLVKQRRYQRK